MRGGDARLVFLDTGDDRYTSGNDDSSSGGSGGGDGSRVGR